MPASYIANGSSNSCNKCRAEDLTNREFGRWTVLSRHSESSKHNHTLWLCKCSCGKEGLVERCNLINDASRGCWECQRNVLLTEYFPRSWYRKQMEQAKVRNIEWNISEKELWEIWDKQKNKCAISGLPIAVDNDTKLHTASIDRIDSKKDYHIENVCFVHKHINLMKYTFGLQYFVEMCKLIAKNNGL